MVENNSNKEDDHESQFILISTFVRLGVVLWAGFIISLNYITFPFLGPQAPKDTSFITFLFGSALATFGIDAKKKDKKENGGGHQIIEIETPIKIVGVDDKKVTKV
tara:strand:+ start:131 stop:448 length:318 start_codon:yes stop_codon:yes gene_type:complete